MFYTVLVALCTGIISISSWAASSSHVPITATCHTDRCIELSTHEVSLGNMSGKDKLKDFFSIHFSGNSNAQLLMEAPSSLVNSDTEDEIRYLMTLQKVDNNFRFDTSAPDGKVILPSYTHERSIGEIPAGETGSLKCQIQLNQADFSKAASSLTYSAKLKFTIKTIA